MSNPPPFESAPQYNAPKKSNLPRTLTIIALAVCLPCTLISYFGYVFGRKALKGFMGMGIEVGGCSVSLATARDAMRDYARDHDGKLPPTANWQADIFPYYTKLIKENLKEMKNETPEVLDVKIDFDQFKSATEAWGCTSTEADKVVKTGIAYNADVAGKELMKIPDGRGTILLFEVPTPKVNNAIPFTEQDKTKSPMILGEKHRGWFTIGLEGVAMMDGKPVDINLKGGINVKTSSKSEPETKADETK